MNKGDMPPQMEAVITQAKHWKDEFRQRALGVDYEAKGILYSEMLFFYTLTRMVGAPRILESGRARGQSTLLLSRLFPEVDIISMEFDPNSPDVEVAAARLKDCNNVTTLFGDATQKMPNMLEQKDVVIIDGPKGHRAVRMALRLLKGGKPALIFMHDTSPGSVERTLLEKLFPNTLYSGQADFARIAHDLDAPAKAHLLDDARWPPARGYEYGFNLCCIFPQSFNYPLAMARVMVDGLVHRLWRRKRN